MERGGGFLDDVGDVATTYVCEFIGFVYICQSVDFAYKRLSINCVGLQVESITRQSVVQSLP